MKYLSFAVPLILSSAALSAAVDFKDADLHPLLRIHTSLFLLPTTEPVVRAGHIDETKVITRGGALISVETVVYYDTTGAGFPACPPEVSKIVQAIREFEDAVTADPSSEVLDSD